MVTENGRNFQQQHKPTIHCNWGNPNPNLDQSITKGWCLPNGGHVLSYFTENLNATKLGLSRSLDMNQFSTPVVLSQTTNSPVSMEPIVTKYGIIDLGSTLVGLSPFGAKSLPEQIMTQLCGLVTPYGDRSGPTLAQVMACCLTAPSHYLNQCWLIIIEVHRHSPWRNFMRCPNHQLLKWTWKPLN